MLTNILYTLDLGRKKERQTPFFHFFDLKNVILIETWQRNLSSTTWYFSVLSICVTYLWMGFWVCSGTQLAGGRVHWVSVQGEPGSRMFVRGRRSKGREVVSTGGSRVQHLHYVLLDSAHSLWLTHSSVPYQMVQPCSWGMYFGL